MAQSAFPSPDDYASFFELCRDEETSSFLERQAHCLRRICTGLSGGCVTSPACGRVFMPPPARAQFKRAAFDQIELLAFVCWLLLQIPRARL